MESNIKPWNRSINTVPQALQGSFLGRYGLNWRYLGVSYPVTGIIFYLRVISAAVCVIKQAEPHHIYASKSTC